MASKSRSATVTKLHLVLLDLLTSIHWRNREFFYCVLHTFWLSEPLDGVAEVGILCLEAGQLLVMTT